MSSIAESVPAVQQGVLTPDERWQLVQYKWRYSLEAQGFDPKQARALIFVRWLNHRRKIEGDLDTPITCARCWRDWQPNGEQVARIAQGLHIVHAGCGWELYPDGGRAA